MARTCPPSETDSKRQPGLSFYNRDIIWIIAFNIRRFGQWHNDNHQYDAILRLRSLSIKKLAWDNGV
jgi:hypothetical protein